MGVDEWLMLCIKIKKLSDRFPDTWAPPDAEEEAKPGDKEEDESEDEKSDEDQESEEGQEKEWELEEVVNVRIADSAQRGTEGTYFLTAIVPCVCITLGELMRHKRYIKHSVSRHFHYFFSLL